MDRCTRCNEPWAAGAPCTRCLLDATIPTASLCDGALELGDEIGRGAMGSVFLARHVRLDRDVAVKFAEATDADTRRRVQREARAMARLQHPHVLRVLDVGEEDGQAFLVTEYAPGGALAEVIPLPPARVREVGIALADALAHAHARGVIHGDVKPQNVLLDADGRALLADFGVARVTGGSSTDVTRATPYYVAPEVLAGASPDARADVFSLGVLLHHALRGTLPVGEVEPLPGPLGAVIRRALAHDPDARFPTASALRDALAATVEAPARPRRWRSWALIALSAALAIGAVGVGLRARASMAPMSGVWYMRSEPIEGRGDGFFVMEGMQQGQQVVLSYGRGVMRCTLSGGRCVGVWWGVSGQGWIELDVARDARRFEGRWGYNQDRARAARMIGERMARPGL